MIYEIRTWFLIKAIAKGAAHDFWCKLRGKPTHWELEIEAEKRRMTIQADDDLAERVRKHEIFKNRES